MTSQDEDRGFYAETFYSAAWVYQGDDSLGELPPSLNSRTRAVSSQSASLPIRNLSFLLRDHAHREGGVPARAIYSSLFPFCVVRERTVKISKGTGEYPWGFRIQFSKPIVVTEVDTSE